MVLENGTTITQTQCAFNSCASTFAYNNDQRVQSVTNPENGTTSYTYNADGTMATKTDAKGQQMVYSSIPKASYIR